MRRRRLIERERAASYLFTMLLAFALSILVTRLFLELSGYPQIGNEQLHIAHVLWGGLIAAVGATLPLVFANTYVLGISAALTGVGLGLFFDEVGKFLTQNNDYFFRPAASVIYVLFLLGVYVYITVRRGEPDAQTRLHHALAAMQEIVDGDLDPQEKADLERMLHATAEAERALPDVRELAGALLAFVREQADVVPARSMPLRDTLRRARQWVESTLLTRKVLRVLLILSTALLGLLSLQGYRNAYAGIALPNPASVRFHEALGFEPIGIYRGVGYKLGKWHDVAWYGCKLPGAASDPPRSMSEVRDDPAFATATSGLE